MPESLARSSIRDWKACIAERYAAIPESRASRAVLTQSVPRPTLRFAAAMSAIKCRRSAGNRGRPRGIDFHCQNSRNPLRCHRMSVSGFTTVRSRRQSIRRDSATSAIRVASSARRGLTFRSRYNANCLRRNRFSAASCACGRNVDDTNRRTSPATRTIVRTSRRERGLGHAAGCYRCGRSS